MIDEGLFALLSANNGGDYLDQVVQGRIFAVEGPPDLLQMPYISYSFVGGSAAPTLFTSGVLRQRVQLDAFAAQPSGALQPGTIAAKIRAAIIARLDRWNQVLSDGTRVLDATLLNPGTDFCTEERIFRCMCEFYVLYTNPTS